jgi:hypothetical protein
LLELCGIEISPAAPALVSAVCICIVVLRRKRAGTEAQTGGNPTDYYQLIQSHRNDLLLQSILLFVSGSGRCGPAHPAPRNPRLKPLHGTCQCQKAAVYEEIANQAAQVLRDFRDSAQILRAPLESSFNTRHE